MKRQATMQASQLEEFALFLEEHPGFSPALKGEDALVCGFRAGECLLTLAEMGRLIATQPHFDAREAALLLASPGAYALRGMTRPTVLDQGPDANETEAAATGPDESPDSIF